MVIFDDVDVFGTKIRKKVMAIVNNILQIGRHFNVSICFTTHSPCAGNETKILLSEANIIVVFPRTTVKTEEPASAKPRHAKHEGSSGLKEGSAGLTLV